MLGYLSKDNSRPDFLSGWKLSGQEVINKGKLWWLDRPIQTPKMPTSMIQLDDNWSCFKIKEELDHKDILRTDHPLGQKFKMGDDQEYYFPQLRVFPSGTALPERIELTENGIVYKPTKKYLRAWEWGNAIWEHIMGTKILDDAEIVQMIEDILSLNYYVTKREILVYGLIDIKGIVPIMRHLIDIAKFEEAIDEQEKKKLYVSSSITISGDSI